MPDFVLADDQNVNVAVNLVDDAGNIVQGVTADAGSVVATVSDPTILEATVSADGGTVNVKALGPEATGVDVEVAAAIAGVDLAAATLAFDVTGSPATSIALVPGTPQHN